MAANFDAKSAPDAQADQIMQSNRLINRSQIVKTVRSASSYTEAEVNFGEGADGDRHA